MKVDYVFLKSLLNFKKNKLKALEDFRTMSNFKVDRPNSTTTFNLCFYYTVLLRNFQQGKKK